jgi:hypothetical protein
LFGKGVGEDMIRIIDWLIAWLDGFQNGWARKIERIQDMLRSWKREIERIQIKLGYRAPKYKPAWMGAWAELMLAQTESLVEMPEKDREATKSITWRRYGKIGG